MELKERFSLLQQQTEDFTCLLADHPDFTRPVPFGLQPVNFPARPAVGPAYTAATLGTDLAAVFTALEQAPAGSVLVIDSRGNTGAAFTGERVCERAWERGLAGIIIDGACRDVEGINRLGFPVYARGTFPAPAQRTGAGATGVPVSLAGVPVQTGDLIAADGNGIVVVPALNLPGLLAALTAAV